MTYPTEMPALTLDFQNSQQLDPRVTFSRSSSATYINSAGLVTSAADHEARFDHDPVTGECLGLLIEESRTNKHSNSTVDALNQGIVGLTQGSASSTIDPTGTASTVETWTVTNDASATNHSGFRFYNNTYVDFTWSLFVKANGINRIQVSASQRDNSTYIDVNLATGVIEEQTDSNATLTKFANGWYRISASLSSRAHGPGFWLLDDSGNRTFQGNGTDGVYVWGIQLEQDPGNLFPTSLIPTSGSTVTRSEDIAQITGTNFSSWYNQSEGAFTYGVHVKTDTGFSGIAEMRVGGSSAGRGRFSRSGERYYMKINGSNAQVTGLNDYPAGFAKLAYRMEPGDYQQAINGVIDNQYAGGGFSNPIPLYDNIRLGISEAYTAYLNGHISRIAYYNTRLSDEQLQTLTA